MTSTHQAPAPTGTVWWATTTPGKVTIVLGGLFAVLFAWVMGVAALVDWALPGLGVIGWLDSWVTPLVMMVLVDAAAVAGVISWRRGERGVIAQVLTWGCLGTGALWTFIVMGTFLAGE